MSTPLPWLGNYAKHLPSNAKQKLSALVFLCVFTLLSPLGFAQSIASWDFANESGNQLSTAGTGSENVTALNFTRGSDLTAVSGSGSINSSGWLGTGNRYYSFGFTVAEGVTINLNTLSIASRSSNTGPGQLALRYSGDGFATNLATWTQSGTTDNIQTIDLSSLSNLSGTVEFRIVVAGTNAAGATSTFGSGGTFRVFNHSTGSVNFTGTISNNTPDEPEPPTPALAIWDFMGQSGNQVATSGIGSTQVTALDFTRGAGVTPTAAANSISGSGWGTDANDYFSFGFTVAEGFEVALQNLIIATRSSGTGPRDIALRYSVDGFENNLATWTQTGTDFNNQIIDLSSLANLTGEVEFRIVVTSNVSANNGTIQSGGTFRVGNFFQDGTFTPVQFNGTVSEIPAPEPVVLVNWNFRGEPGNQDFTTGTNEVSGVLARNFARGSGLNVASATNSISSNGWSTDANDYFTFGFNIAPGKLVDLTALQLGTRSSGTGPRDMALQYSVDGFTSNLATWTSQDAFLNQTIDLSSLANLSGDVEFRIVTLSTTSANGGTIGSGGTFRVTNFFPDNLGVRFIGIVKDGGTVNIPSLVLSPESLNFGVVNLNSNVATQSYTLTASNLSDAVNIVATAPFSLSKDGVAFSQNLTFSVAELASPQTVFVKLSTETEGTFSANITHQTAGTFSVNLAVSATVFDPFNIRENFNTSCPAGLPAGWEAISLSGNEVWACTTFGRAGTTPTASAPFGLQINGFSAGAPRLNEDWLITPAFDLSDFDFPLLSFWSRVAFTGPRLRLLLSTDYVSGDPNTATWTELSDRFANGDVWTFSEQINLDNFKTTGVRIAFVYTSSPELNAARWTLDDFELVNSQNPPAPPTPFLASNLGNTDYFHFGILPVGTPSAQTRTFSFTLRNAIDDLVISNAGGFEFSKNGIDFSPSLTYSATEASTNNTVTVRFFPTSEGAFSSVIQFESGAITQKRGFLTGATLERNQTFDVVTWNIEWFGSTASGQGPSNVDLQLQNVKTILEDLDADVYAFQEITGIQKFNELVAALPGYRGFLSPAVSQGDFIRGQKVAFLYKTATVDSVRTQVLLQGVQPSDLVGYPSTPDRFWASGRLPYLFEVRANIGGVQKNINLINVHARSNGGGESAANPRYAMRRYDVNVLKDTLDAYYADVPFIILGDYNDDLDETVADPFAATVNTTETSYINYINDTANYIPVTLNLSNAGLRTFITFENVIDHVIISNELEEDWLVNSERVVVPFDLVTNYQNTTSDHLPVKVRFELKAEAFNVGACTLTQEDFFGAEQIAAAQEVTYADFSRKNGTYVIGVGTGIREDGRAGAWEIHNDCSIQSIRRSGNQNNTTLLPNIRGIEFERGWRYVPTHFSEDGKEIFGYAINDNGFTHPRGWRVEPGTVVDIKFTLGNPFYGRIFGVSGQILCDDLFVETFASNFFVRGCRSTPLPNLGQGGKAAETNTTSATQVFAYPNPVQDKLQVVIESQVAEEASLSVYNVLGKVIFTQALKLNKGSNQIELDGKVWGTENGMYFLRIQTATQGTLQSKIVKE